MDRGKPGKIPQENASRNDPESISSIFEKKRKKNETNILINRFNATQIKTATPPFSDTEKNSPKIHMGLQKSPPRYSNPEKYKLLLEDHHTWFQAMLQSKSIK